MGIKVEPPVKFNGEPPGIELDAPRQEIRIPSVDSQLANHIASR